MFFYARASTPYNARSYGTAGFTATPSSLAARRTKYGSRKKDKVRLALCQQVVRLLGWPRGCRDHFHGAHDDVWMSLLDRLRKRNLRERCENGCYRVIVSPICVSIPGISRPDRNLLCCPVSPRADFESGRPRASSAHRLT
jgi:hypothetical protein